ncbi:MAG: class I SAM-dependent methyltransferase [Candidatus Eisenbacteria bacterium]|nr:class I SAM-dependent methyltransferase [Candidatus Eisenbacteria bacterium]
MENGHADNLTERYDREAHVYRELWAPILRRAGLELVRELASERVDRILDVGTGVGSLLPDLSMTFPGALVLGVDRSRGMLALAPAEFPRAAMDARRLALRSNSVDLVLMAFMLFHVEQPVDALREARRVLRRGGRVATLTWGGSLESNATRIWAECLDRHGAIAADPAAEARHEALDAPKKMEILLRDTGFTSPRCWANELVSTLDLEHVLRLKTSLGSSKPRFDSLDPPAQDACVAGARRRMEALARADFVARGGIVYAQARA